MTPNANSPLRRFAVVGTAFDIIGFKIYTSPFSEIVVYGLPDNFPIYDYFGLPFPQSDSGGNWDNGSGSNEPVRDGIFYDLVEILWDWYNN